MSNITVSKPQEESKHEVGFLNWIKNFIGFADEGQAIETAVSTGYETNDYWPDVDYWEDNLHQFYEPLKGLKLTRSICSKLEQKISNDPVVSNCFVRLLSMADTDFDIELELEIGDEEKALNEIKDSVPKLFYFTNDLRSVSSLIISRQISYGLFAAQFQYDDNQKIQSVILPPPYSINWRRMYNNWQLVQNYSGRISLLERSTFIYEPLFVIQNEKGIFPVAPFKAALKSSDTYELFLEALAQIARRTGMNKILDIIVKKVSPSEVQAQTKGVVVKTGSQEDLKDQNGLSAMMNRFGSMFRRTLPNGYLIHPDTVEVKDLATYEPSQNIMAFHDLLASQTIIGCKMYPALVGIVTKENQTTLSTNQKLATKAFVETLQSKTDSVMHRIITEWLISNNYLVKSLRIKRQPAQIETTLDDEKAKEVRLKNEMTEKAMQKENDAEVIDQSGSIDQDKNNSEEKEKSEEV